MSQGYIPLCLFHKFGNIPNQREFVYTHSTIKKPCVVCAKATQENNNYKFKMNSEEFSCIKQVVKTVQLSLPFMYVTNDYSGITGVLDSWKRQFVKQLNGIVVSYKNVSLTSRIGAINTQKSYALYNVKATFDLFCPNIGDIVKGKINRISKEHIGCLIHGTINVTIHLPRNYPAELSKYIYLDREILFEIANFICEPKMVRVTGNVTPKCIELMKNLFSSFEDSVSEKEDSSSDEETAHVNLSILNSIKAATKLNEDIKPTKRKRESESSTMESSEESSKTKISGENNKLPKKKKSKHLDASLTDSIENLSQKPKISLDSIPTDSLKKSPKKKKSKIKLDTNLTDSPEKSAKKKKSKSSLDLNLTDSSEKSPKQKKSKINLDLNLNDSSEKSPKKKKSKINLDLNRTDSPEKSPKKEKSKINLDLNWTDSPEKSPKKEKSEINLDVNSTVTDMEAFNNIGILEAIKKEIGSSSEPSSSSTVSDVNKKKRKRESTASGEVKDPKKKKKHKKKNKDGLKSSKDKKKPSKKKAKVAASGTVLKKDKKSSKGKKPSKKEKSGNKSETSKKKNKKGHKKDKSKKEKNKKIKLETNFEDVKKIKSE